MVLKDREMKGIQRSRGLRLCQLSDPRSAAQQLAARIEAQGSGPGGTRCRGGLPPPWGWHCQHQEKRGHVSSTPSPRKDPLLWVGCPRASLRTSAESALARRPRSGQDEGLTGAGTSGPALQRAGGCRLTARCQVLEDAV